MPPVAVRVVEFPLHMVVIPVIPVGALEGWLTVTTCVGPPVFTEQGEAVFSIRTQYVVVLPGETLSVKLVSPTIGDVPTTLPVPHW